MSQSKKFGPTQLELPLGRGDPRSKASEGLRSTCPPLRVIEGEGAGKEEPTIVSREGVVHALIEAGADLLLRRISSERAEEIRRTVDRIMSLFDRVDASPQLMPALRRQLDELEDLMRETRAIKARKGK